ncbi:MAG: DUF2809 domain-containing protein [Bacteroides sp.]|nr:DUF2809 domain-containing protein [Bacteroides sp.]
MYKKIHSNRWFYLCCGVGIFIIETLIAMYVHDAIIRPYIGDILVVVLVYCFLRIFIDRPLRLLPLWVFLFACAIEFMQYFRMADVLGFQHNTIARIVLGSVFDWKDIMCYTVGCLPLFFIKK